MTNPDSQCVRCGKTEPRLSAAPMPGAVGKEIVDKICQSCWNEWIEAEVMVINELRLNFMEPKSLQVLEQHMREFLVLDGPAKAE